MRIIDYKEGDIIGKCIYLCDSERINKYKRRAKFKCCDCGSIFEATISNVKNNHTKSCGCYRRGGEYNKKHGMRNHPLYGKWNSIKNRCYNENTLRYNDWGGRGITMYNEWIYNFKSFYDYITNLTNYNLDLTLDRIDNDGNYEPGNLRWATIQQQNKNKRKYKNSKK